MPRTGKGKILVIDDDEKVLSIARRNLESAGYEVLVTNSALKMPQIGVGPGHTFLFLQPRRSEGAEHTD